MKLLVVEDDPSIRHYLETLLTHWGHRALGLCCNTQADESEVLEHVKLLNFDAALVGFVMPATLGTDLAVEIRRLAPAIKIIVATEAVPQAIAAALRHRGVEFRQLPVPFRHEELLRELRAPSR
jgi:DNA-binding NtrC family response regulator